MCIYTNTCQLVNQISWRLPLQVCDRPEHRFASRPLTIIPKATKALNDDAKVVLGKIHVSLSEVSDWNKDTLQSAIENFVESEEIGFGKVAQPLRAALTGSNVSPGISEVLDWLGKEESLTRIKDQQQ